MQVIILACFFSVTLWTWRVIELNQLEEIEGLPSSHLWTCDHSFSRGHLRMISTYFCDMLQTPWRVNTKFLTNRAFHITMCKPTMWSHMHEPFLSNFSRWFKLPFICLCRSSCGCRLLSFFGCPINHHWKVNVYYLKVTRPLEFVIQLVQTHPWSIKVQENENYFFL